MYPAGGDNCRVRQVRISDELTMRVVECGDESAPPLILLHGWGCSAFAFHKNISPVAAAGYRVIVPDLKGHGLSSKPGSPPSYGTSEMVGQIAKLADILGISRFAIAGHSMGAAIALRFAIANPRRVTALGLLSPVGTSGLRFLSLVRLLTPTVSLPFLRLVNTRLVTRFFLRLAYGKHGSPTEREVEEYWAPSQFPEFTTALRHLLHAFNWGPIYIGGLDAYQFPILVLSGGRDHLCRKRTLTHIRRSLRCEPEVIDGAGHLILSETPDRVNAALVRLLGK
jgi:pimeloyl-ACP methyl ester carboxylesterase